MKNNTTGRKSGFVVSYDSKQKARMSNPNRLVIKTPYGTYDSMIVACEVLNLNMTSLRNYCRVGHIQRTEGMDAIKAHRDYRDWEIIGGKRKSHCRRVQTPHGTFRSVTAAADHENITPGALCHKLKRGESGYMYLDN